MFCAKTSTREPRVESTIACRSVNGTQIATSTPSIEDTRGSSAWMYSSASSTVLCIFQLPAMNGVRATTQSTSRPGSFLPSSSCSEAPPPVDMCVIWSSSPNCASAAALSPPPTTVTASVAATASATARVPASNGFELERAHRPVPEDRAGRRDLLRVELGGRRADVEAHEALGHVDVVALDRLGVGGELRAEHVVDRQAQLAAGLLERARRGLDARLLAQRRADLVALGLEERVAHRAADEDRVGDLQEGVDDADLVGDLRAADDRDERPARVREDPGQRLDLALQQAARGRALDVLDDADRRGVRAVRGAEGVVDVEVREIAEALGQLGVVLRLARLEADVLEHHDVAVGHVVEVRRERRRRRRAGPTRCSATGCSENSGSRSFGRPRCETSSSFAPRSRSSSIVGSAPRMRASSVTVSPSSGTLKSTRTRPRRPSMSPRSSSVRTYRTSCRTSTQRFE